jgi:hypothetical protein
LGIAKNNSKKGEGRKNSPSNYICHCLFAVSMLAMWAGEQTSVYGLRFGCFGIGTVSIQ